MSTLLFATSNPHKIQEVRAVLAPLGIDVVGLDSLDQVPEEPEEDGATFADNARLKAVHYAASAGRRCLADDSGLVVDCLDGRPGVHSARYAAMGSDPMRPGPMGSDPDQRDAANNAKLLGELRGVPAARRTARFLCAMCLADPDGTLVAETEGAFEGVITLEPRGSNGFGYDPLLYLPAEGRTAAELSPDEKNARSHRGAAARAMARRIGELRGG